MARLDGKIAVSGLPAHRGLILSLCFYRVDDADAPAPHDGDPPAEAATDCHEVFKQVHLDVESEHATYDVPFSIEQPAGFYYLQARAILFRREADKVFAQTEQVFFVRRPARIPLELEGTVTLPFPWPHRRLQELHHHGVVRPQPNKAWWRFW